MKSPYILNPHCSEPKLSKDKTRWSIQFFYEHNGTLKKKKADYNLNLSPYLIKEKSVVKERNKIDRKRYADDIIARLDANLKKDYFNPDTATFEVSDKAELPFSLYLDQYLTYNPKKKREESSIKIYKSYNNVIKAYLETKGIGDISLNGITRELVEKFLAYIDDKGTTTQRDHYLTYLKGVFKYCHLYLEIINRNPLQLIHRISTDESSTNKAYPKELKEEVLAEAKNLDIQFWILLRMIYHTLRRPEELVSLRYKDFDFEKGAVRFSSDIIKTNKVEHSYLSPNLISDITEMIPKDIGGDDYFLGCYAREGKAKYVKDIFAPFKTPYEHYKDKFKTLQRRMNLEAGYTIYSFKHTGVVYLVEEEGWTDNEIIQDTGHTNTKILQRYSKDARRERRLRSDNV